MAVSAEDASSLELGLLPEEMMVDDEIQKLNGHSNEKVESQPEE